MVDLCRDSTMPEQAPIVLAFGEARTISTTSVIWSSFSLPMIVVVPWLQILQLLVVPQ